MKKIKAFFYVFYKSITSFEYYKDIFNTPFSFSMKYLAVLALAATIITTGVNTAKTVPEINQWIYTQKDELLRMYPEDLVIKVENNEWSINKEQPYKIRIPSTFKVPGQELPKNLVVFDKEGTINDFYDENTVVLINENNALIQSETRLEVYPLQNMPDGEFNRNTFAMILSQADQIIKFVPVFFVIINMVVLYLYYFVFRAIYLLVVSLILLIVNIVIKPTIEFSNLYRIALHSMTIPLLIDIVLKAFDVMYVGFPWFIFLNILLGTFVIAKSAKIND